MKKSKAVAATAMLFCAAANLTACVYGPPQNVYGPPPDVDAVEETVEETVEESDEASETSDSEG